MTSWVALSLGIALAVAVQFVAADIHGEMEIDSKWPTGFKGLIKVPVNEEIKGGWSMKIEFSTEVKNIQIWRAKTICNEKNKIYYFHDLDWNKDITGPYTIHFIAERPTGTRQNPLSASFIITPGYTPTPPCYKPTTHPPTTIPPSTLPPTTQLPETTQIPETTQVSDETTTLPRLDGPIMEVVDTWKESIKGRIRIPLYEEGVTGGWQMKVEFSSEVSRIQIWRAMLICNIDNKIFYFKNMEWNTDLPKGEFELFIIADRDGEDPSATVEFTPLSDSPPEPPCSGSGTTASPGTDSPTQPPATQPPATQPPATQPPATQPPATQPPATQPPATQAPETEAPATQAPVTTVPPETQAPATTKPSKYNYGEVLHKSILFYEAQRSGKLPSNNRVSWRKDSALTDKGDNGQDLTGGWYDAGDYVKFGLPMAASTTVLAWGLIEFSEGYENANELENMKDCIKWPADYFVKARTGDNEFYAQVGDGETDHKFWGRPEDMTMNRPAFKVTQQKPGSDVAGETAAALAATSLALRNSDQQYSTTLLEHARKLYKFAKTYTGKYSDSISDAGKFYSSSGYWDELAWAAAWLSAAETTDQKKQSYLADAEQFYISKGLGNRAWSFDWDNKAAGVQLLLFKLTKKDSYKQAITGFLDSWLPEGGMKYTPSGLAWRSQWGANRYSANVAFLATVAVKLGLNPTKYNEFAQKQIHYMLGDNKNQRSFVVGYGNNPPLQPHHASSSCGLAPEPCGWNEFNQDKPNAHVLNGALVGGPSEDDSYQDKRADYIHNEVTTDYNAGFQSAVAALNA